MRPDLLKTLNKQAENDLSTMQSTATASNVVDSGGNPELIAGATMTQDFGEYKADKQSGFDKTTKGIYNFAVEATLGSAEAVADIPDVFRAMFSDKGIASMAEDDFRNDIAAWLGKQKEDAKANVYHSANHSEFVKGLLNGISDGTLASGVVSLVPGMAFGKGIGLLAKGFTKGALRMAKASKYFKEGSYIGKTSKILEQYNPEGIANTASQILGGLSSTVYSNAWESVKSMQTMLPQMKKQMEDAKNEYGEPMYTPEQIDQKLEEIGMGVYYGNLGNAVLDGIGIFQMFKPGIKTTRNIMSKQGFGKNLKDMTVKEAVPEAIQEINNHYQEQRAQRNLDIELGNVSIFNPYDVNELMNDPNTWSAGALGGLGGYGFQVAGPAFNQIGENKRTNKAAQRYQDWSTKAIDEAKALGWTDEQIETHLERLDKSGIKPKVEFRKTFQGVGGALLTGQTLSEKEKVDKQETEIEEMDKAFSNLGELLKKAETAENADLAEKIKLHIAENRAFRAMQSGTFGQLIDNIDRFEKNIQDQKKLYTEGDTTAQTDRDNIVEAILAERQEAEPDAEWTAEKVETAIKEAKTKEEKATFKVDDIEALDQMIESNGDAETLASYDNLLKDIKDKKDVMFAAEKAFIKGTKFHGFNSGELKEYVSGKSNQAILGKQINALKDELGLDLTDDMEDFSVVTRAALETAGVKAEDIDAYMQDVFTEKKGVKLPEALEGIESLTTGPIGEKLKSLVDLIHQHNIANDKANDVVLGDFRKREVARDILREMNPEAENAVYGSDGIYASIVRMQTKALLDPISSGVTEMDFIASLEEMDMNQALQVVKENPDTIKSIQGLQKLAEVLYTKRKETVKSTLSPFMKDGKGTFEKDFIAVVNEGLGHPDFYLGEEYENEIQAEDKGPKRNAVIASVLQKLMEKGDANIINMAMEDAHLKGAYLPVLKALSQHNADIHQVLTNASEAVKRAKTRSETPVKTKDYRHHSSTQNLGVFSSEYLDDLLSRIAEIGQEQENLGDLASLADIDALLAQIEAIEHFLKNDTKYIPYFQKGRKTELGATLKGLKKSIQETKVKVENSNKDKAARQQKKLKGYFLKLREALGMAGQDVSEDLFAEFEKIQEEIAKDPSILDNLDTKTDGITSEFQEAIKALNTSMSAGNPAPKQAQLDDNKGADLNPFMVLYSALENIRASKQNPHWTEFEVEYDFDLSSPFMKELKDKTSQEDWELIEKAVTAYQELKNVYHLRGFMSASEGLTNKHAPGHLNHLSALAKAESTEGVRLFPEQRVAVFELVQNYYTQGRNVSYLQGLAGTGKSKAVMKVFLRTIQILENNVHGKDFSAGAMAKGSEANSIITESLMGKTSDIEHFVDGAGLSLETVAYIEGLGNLLIVDEIGKLSTLQIEELYTLIAKKIEQNPDFKVVLTGDPHQLRGNGNYTENRALMYSDKHPLNNRIHAVSPLTVQIRSGSQAINSLAEEFVKAHKEGIVSKEFKQSSYTENGKVVSGAKINNDHAKFVSELKQAVADNKGTPVRVITDYPERYENIDGISVVTPERAQGSEYDIVFVDVSYIKDNFNGYRASNARHYVAISRAIKYVNVYSPDASTASVTKTSLPFNASVIMSNQEVVNQNKPEAIEFMRSQIEAYGVVIPEPTPIDEDSDQDDDVDQVEDDELEDDTPDDEWVDDSVVPPHEDDEHIPINIDLDNTDSDIPLTLHANGKGVVTYLAENGKGSGAVAPAEIIPVNLEDGSQALVYVSKVKGPNGSARYVEIARSEVGNIKLDGLPALDDRNSYDTAEVIEASIGSANVDISKLRFLFNNDPSKVDLQNIADTILPGVEVDAVIPFTYTTAETLNSMPQMRDQGIGIETKNASGRTTTPRHALPFSPKPGRSYVLVKYKNTSPMMVEIDSAKMSVNDANSPLKTLQSFMWDVALAEDKLSALGHGQVRFGSKEVAGTFVTPKGDTREILQDEIFLKVLDGLEGKAQSDPTGIIKKALDDINKDSDLKKELIAIRDNLYTYSDTRALKLNDTELMTHDGSTSAYNKYAVLESSKTVTEITDPSQLSGDLLDAFMMKDKDGNNVFTAVKSKDRYVARRSFEVKGTQEDGTVKVHHVVLDYNYKKDKDGVFKKDGTYRLRMFDNSGLASNKAYRVARVHKKFNKEDGKYNQNNELFDSLKMHDGMQIVEQSNLSGDKGDPSDYSKIEAAAMDIAQKGYIAKQPGIVQNTFTSIAKGNKYLYHPTEKGVRVSLRRANSGSYSVISLFSTSTSGRKVELQDSTGKWNPIPAKNLSYNLRDMLEALTSTDASGKSDANGGFGLRYNVHYNTVEGYQDAKAVDQKDRTDAQQRTVNDFETKLQTKFSGTVPSSASIVDAKLYETGGTPPPSPPSPPSKEEKIKEINERRKRTLATVAHVEKSNNEEVEEFKAKKEELLAELSGEKTTRKKKDKDKEYNIIRDLLPGETSNAFGEVIVVKGTYEEVVDQITKAFDEAINSISNKKEDLWIGIIETNEEDVFDGADGPTREHVEQQINAYFDAELNDLNSTPPSPPGPNGGGGIHIPIQKKKKKKNGNFYHKSKRKTNTPSLRSKAASADPIHNLFGGQTPDASKRLYQNALRAVKEVVSSIVYDTSYNQLGEDLQRDGKISQDLIVHFSNTLNDKMAQIVMEYNIQGIDPELVEVLLDMDVEARLIDRRLREFISKQKNVTEKMDRDLAMLAGISHILKSFDADQDMWHNEVLDFMMDKLHFAGERSVKEQKKIDELEAQKKEAEENQDEQEAEGKAIGLLDETVDNRQKNVSKDLDRRTKQFLSLIEFERNDGSKDYVDFAFAWVTAMDLFQNNDGQDKKGFADFLSKESIKSPNPQRRAVAKALMGIINKAKPTNTIIRNETLKSNYRKVYTSLYHSAGSTVTSKPYIVLQTYDQFNEGIEYKVKELDPISLATSMRESATTLLTSLSKDEIEFKLGYLEPSDKEVSRAKKLSNFFEGTEFSANKWYNYSDKELGDIIQGLKTILNNKDGAVGENLKKNQSSNLKKLAANLVGSQDFVQAQNYFDVKGNRIYINITGTFFYDAMNTLLIDKGEKVDFITQSNVISDHNLLIKEKGRITGIVEFDGMHTEKKDGFRKGKPMKDFTQGEMFQSVFNASFITPLTYKSENPKYIQLTYTQSNRASLSGAKMSFLSMDEFREVRSELSKQEKRIKAEAETEFDSKPAANFETKFDGEFSLDIHAPKIVEAIGAMLDNVGFSRVTGMKQLSKAHANLIQNKSLGYHELLSSPTMASIRESITAVYAQENEQGEKILTEDHKKLVDLFTMFYLNNYYNGQMLNQIVFGHSAFVTSEYNQIKRMSGINSPGKKQYVSDNPLEGNKPISKAITFANDLNLITKLNDPTGEFSDIYVDDLKKGLDRADAVVFGTPTTLEGIHKGTSNEKLGDIIKTMYFTVDPNGKTQYIKMALFIISDSLAEQFPELKRLRDKMDKAGVEYGVMNSAHKVGSKSNLKKWSDPISEQDKFDIHNKHMRIQGDPKKDKLSYDLANFSQFDFFFSVPTDHNGDLLNTKETFDAYTFNGHIMKDQAELYLKQQSWYKDGKVNKKALAIELAAAMPDSDERVRSMIIQGISMDNPILLQRIVMLLANQMYKKGGKINHSGAKLTNQSDLGVQVFVGSDGKPVTYDKLKDGSKEKELADEFFRLSPSMRAYLTERQTIIARDPSKEFTDAMREELIGRYNIKDTNKLKELEKKKSPRNILMRDSEGYTEVIAPRWYAKHLKKLDAELAAGKISQEQYDLLNRGMAVRIPTTGIHSSIAFKIVGFSDNINNFIAPKEIVTIHGSDFDVDAVFAAHLELHTGWEVDGQMKEAMESLKEYGLDTFSFVGVNLKGKPDHTFIAALTRLIDEHRGDTNSAVFEKLLDLRIKATKNMKLITYLNTISDPKNREHMNAPIDFRPMEELQEALEDLYKEKLKEKRDLDDVADNMKMFSDNFAGARGVGIMASSMKVLAYLQYGGEILHNGDRVRMKDIRYFKEDVITTLEDGTKKRTHGDIVLNNGTILKGSEVTKAPVTFGGDFNVMYNGEQMDRLVYTNLEGKLTFNVGDTILNGYIDNVAEQVTSVLNASADTIATIALMNALGYPLNSIAYFNRQPIMTYGTRLGGAQTKVEKMIQNLEQILEVKADEVSYPLNDKTLQDVLKQIGKNGSIEGLIEHYQMEADPKKKEALYGMLLAQLQVGKDYLQFKKMTDQLRPVGRLLKNLQSTEIFYEDMHATEMMRKEFKEIPINSPNFLQIPHIHSALEGNKQRMRMLEQVSHTYSTKLTKHLIDILGTLPLSEDVYQKENKKAFDGFEFSHESLKWIRAEFSKYVISAAVDRYIDKGIVTNVRDGKTYMGVNSSGELLTEDQMFQGEDVPQELKDAREAYLQAKVGYHQDKTEQTREAYNQAYKDLNTAMVNHPAKSHTKLEPEAVFMHMFTEKVAALQAETGRSNNLFLDLMAVSKDQKGLKRLNVHAGTALNAQDTAAVIDHFTKLSTEMRQGFIAYSLLKDGGSFGFRGMSQFFPPTSSAPFKGDGMDLYDSVFTDSLRKIAENPEDHKQTLENFTIQLLANNAAGKRFDTNALGNKLSSAAQANLGPEFDGLHVYPAPSQSDTSKVPELYVDQDYVYRLSGVFHPSGGYVTYERVAPVTKGAQVYRYSEGEVKGFHSVISSRGMNELIANGTSVHVSAPLYQGPKLAPKVGVISNMKGLKVTDKFLSIEVDQQLEILSAEPTGQKKFGHDEYKVVYQTTKTVVPGTTTEGALSRLESQPSMKGKIVVSATDFHEDLTVTEDLQVSAQELFNKIQPKINNPFLTAFIRETKGNRLHNTRVVIYKGKGVDGFYNPEENIIGISEELYNAVQDENLNIREAERLAHIIAHEVVHVATVSPFSKNPEDLTAAESSYVANMQHLFAEAKAALGSDPDLEDTFSSVEEFIAEAISNPDLQERLNQIESTLEPGMTIWRWLLNAILDLFDGGLNSRSVFARVIEQSLNFAQKQEINIDGKPSTVFYHKSQIKAITDQLSTSDNSEYYTDKDDKKWMRAHTTLNEIGTEMHVRDEQTALDLADRIFKKARKNGTLRNDNDAKGDYIEMGGLKFNQNEYAAEIYRKHMYAIGIGKMGHAIMEAQGETDPAVNTQLAEIIKAYEIYGVDKNSIDHFDQQYERLFQGPHAEVFFNSKDTHYQEKVISMDFKSKHGNEEIEGIAGTVDKMVDHGDNVLTLIDFKSGKFSSHWMKESLKGSNLPANPENLGKLQMALYAFMLRNADSNVKFRDIKILKIGEFADGSAAINVELQPFLDVLEHYFTTTHSEFMADMSKEKKADLFNAKGYIESSKHISNISENVEAGLKAANRDTSKKAINGQVLNIITKALRRDRKVSENEWDEDKQKEHKNYVSMLMELVSGKNILKEGIQETSSYLQGNLDNRNRVKGDLERIYSRFFGQRKFAANSEKLEIMSRHNKLVDAVAKEAKTGNRGALLADYEKTWGFLYEAGGDIVTYNSASWKSLSTAQKNYADFYRSMVRYQLFKTMNPKEGIKHINAELALRKGMSEEFTQELKDQVKVLESLLDTRGDSFNKFADHNTRVAYYEGWTPRYKAQPEEQKVAHRMRESVINSVSIPREEYERQIAKKDKNKDQRIFAVPLTGVVDSNAAEFSDKDVYTKNAEIAFGKFITSAVEKNHYDDALLLGMEMKEVLEDTYGKNSKAIESSLKWFTNQLDHVILKKTRDDFTGAHFYKIKNKEGEVERYVTYDKSLRALRIYMGKVQMHFKYFQAIRRSMSAVLILGMEGVSGSLAKFMGVSHVDFTISDSMEAITHVFASYTGKLSKKDKHKVAYFNALLGNLPESYDYLGDNKAKGRTTQDPMFMNKINDLGYAVDKTVDNMNYTIVLISQLKAMKVMVKGKPVSMYDLYQPDGKGGFYYAGPTRGVDATTGEKVDGLTGEESDKLLAISERMYGSYRTDERNYLEAGTVGFLMMQFKKWAKPILSRGWMDKFENQTIGEWVATGKTVKDENGIELPELPQLEWVSRTDEGFNQTTLRYMWASKLFIKDAANGFEEFKKLSPQQQFNIIFAVTKYSTYGALVLGVSATMGGADSDDRNLIKQLISQIQAEIMTESPVYAMQAVTGFFNLPVISKGGQLFSGLAKVAKSLIFGEKIVSGPNKGSIKGLPQVLKNTYGSAPFYYMHLWSESWGKLDKEIQDDMIQSQRKSSWFTDLKNY